MVLDNLAATVSPDDARYLNRYELLRERLASRDVDMLSGILCDKDEAKRRDDAASQQAQAQQEQTNDLLRAEVRKILAEATKAITQADKNAAAADQSQAKTMIDTLNASLGQLEGDIDGKRTDSSTGKSEGGTGAVSKDAAPKQGRADGPSPIQVANNPVGTMLG